MTLTVEDGSVVAGANSYVSVADMEAWAEARNIDLLAVYAATRKITEPTGDDATAAIEGLLINAMDYLESLRGEYQGMKTAKDNPLQWPRSSVIIDGWSLDDDEIPDCLVQAQMRLAYDCAALGDLTPVGDGRVIIHDEVVGAVVTKYADHGNSNPQPQLTAARALIAPLLKSGLFGGAGIAIRV